MCSSEDKYIAGGTNSLVCWFARPVGIECKRQLKLGQDCVDNPKTTTDHYYYFDAQFKQSTEIQSFSADCLKADVSLRKRAPTVFAVDLP